ncbi:MAG: hypothetical protein K2K45_00855 [Muribaculaceae bacterium]|nr:hypothetical protein [Muribaculaceae bacterium]
MKQILRYLVPTAVFVIFAFWILAVKNGFMLRWYDEMSLFEPGTASLNEFLHYPGGIFRFAGTFMTQFLFYPALGAGALIILWLLCAWLTGSAFRFSGAGTPLCFLVPFCLLASILHFDEACLTFESQGYVFYNTIGFTFSIAAYALFVCLRRYRYAGAAIAVILPLLYPLAGFFTLLAAAMCAIALSISAVRDKNAYLLAVPALSVILTAAVPPLYYRFFNGTTADNDYLYLKGLPELTMNGYDMYLWQPFAIATALLVIFTLVSAFTDREKTKSSKTAAWSSATLFLAGMICCIGADARKSEQLRATVLMIDAIERHDWKKATHIMSLTKESPNYTMCVLDNLARAYCGMPRKSTEGMTTETRDFRHNEDFTINAFVDVPVNHNIGRFNQSHRWATENNVLYGKRVYFIRYIVRNALMNGDIDFARKFNRQLKRTMFHRRWAEETERYLDNPELIKTLPDYDFLSALRSEEIMRGE